MDDKKRAENLFAAIGDVDEELLHESEHPVRKRVHYKQYLAAAAVFALCFLVMHQFMPLKLGGDKQGNSGSTGLVVNSGKQWISDFGDEAEKIIEAKETPEEKKEKKGEQTYNENSEPDETKMTTITSTAKAGEGDGDDKAVGHPMDLEETVYTQWVSGLFGGTSKNMVYSPMSVSMEMAMVAEISEDKSRQQILDAMGIDEMDSLVALQDKLGRNAKDCCSNGLFLRNDWTYGEDVLSKVAEEYRATSFVGKMGTANYNTLYADWLNEESADLLQKEATSEKFSKETQIGVSSTFLYKANWKTEKALIKDQTFYAVTGEKTVDMFSGTSKYETYRGKHFMAVAVPLSDGKKFYVFLPDEGHSVSEIYKDSAREDILSGNVDAVKKKMNLVLPCFTITAKQNLIPVMKNLGINRIFKSGYDFERLVLAQKACISKLEHAVGIQIDENGVTAESKSNMPLLNTTASGLTEELIVNRPFGFAIADKDGVVYFEGQKME